MSQSYEQFNIAAVDPFLTPPEQETHFSRILSDDLRVVQRVDHPIFSPNSDDVLDELDFSFHDLYEAQIDSSDSSSVSTPEPYSHHPRSLDSDLSYPVALPSTIQTHGYKNQRPDRLDIAHIHGIHEHEHPSTQRPNDDIDSPVVSPRCLPYGSSATSDFLRPALTPQSYVRRRSLSHSDIDHPPNPTFVRLQQRRVKSTTPEEKRRHGPYPKHVRATSGGRSKGRPVQAPSLSRRNSHVNTMAPIHNGTSLDPHDETLNGTEVSYDPLLDDEFFLNHMLAMHQNGPVIRYMTDLHDLERSRHIIEIGAMSAVSHPRDTHVEQTHGETELECMLKNLENVELYLRERYGDPKVLEACTMIRETLSTEIAKDNLDGDVRVIGKEGDNATEAPTGMLSADDWDVYIGDEDESGITAMLMMMMEHEDILADESG